MAIYLLDLLNRDTQMRRVAATHGGEYAGPCPFCGGSDRFRAWPDAERPGWWCRQCDRRGDAIQYVREHDGLSFRQACMFLGIAPGTRPAFEAAEVQPPALELDPPSETWQKRAVAFCRYAVEKLWSAEGAEMLAYLHGRGLKDETIRAAALGYNPADLHDAGEKWGLESVVWLPAGLVIPCRVDGNVWRVNIRRSGGAEARRYVLVHGSIQALYRADLLKSDTPAMILESDLDALLVHQEAGDIVTALALGGAGNARHLHWLCYLATPSDVLISTDADEAGETAGAWWVRSIPGSRRWMPLVKDPTEMAALGLSVREWIEYAFIALPAAPAAPAPEQPAPVYKAADLPPAPLRPVESLRVIQGNPAAPRVYIDPDSQASLKAVKLLPWQVLVNQLPRPMRQEALVIQAAKKYDQAGQPHLSVQLWPQCVVPDHYRGIKLWHFLADAIGRGGESQARAMAVLERLAQNGGQEEKRRGYA